MSSHGTSSRVNGAAARGVLLSMTLRLLSFTLSQLTLRLVDPIVLGRASIRLELGLSTALFLGREGFRLALMRQSGSVSLSEKDSATRNNVVWLIVPVTMLLSFASLFVQLAGSPISSSTSSDKTFILRADHKIAAFLYCLATCIESLSEPVQICCLWTFDVTSRAIAEGTASIARAFMSVIMLRWGEALFGIGPVSSFGMAQVTYAVLLSLILYMRKWKTKGIPFPTLQRNNRSHLFHKPTLDLTISFTLQSIFKHLLTEGDRLILTLLLSDYDQGIYAMASSYGSIVCRTVFQPLEENARWLFSTQASSLNEISAHETVHHGTRKKEDASISESSLQALQQTFCTWVKLAVYLSIPFAALAPNYSQLALRIIAGKRWGDIGSGDTLAYYCLYVFVLGVNGITEAFVYGVVGTIDDTKSNHRGSIAKLTLVHGIVGVIFYISAPIFVWYGIHSLSTTPAAGLICANSLAAFLRIVYSFSFASNVFAAKMVDAKKSRPSNRLSAGFYLVCDCLPHWSVLLSFIGSYFVTRHTWSKFGSSVGFESITSIPNEILVHLGVGLSCALGNIAMVLFFERHFIKQVKSMMNLKSRRKQD